MKRKLIFVGILLLSIINLSALGTIGYHRWFRGSPMHGKNCRSMAEAYLYRELDLSEEQMEQIKLIRQKFHSQADPVNSDLLQKRAQLVDLIEMAATENDRIHQILTDIEDLQAQLQQQVIQFIQQEKTVLNSDQQRKYFAIIRENLNCEAKHNQTSGLDPLENNCSQNCDSINSKIQTEGRR